MGKDKKYCSLRFDLHVLFDTLFHASLLMGVYLVLNSLGLTGTCEDQASPASL